MNQNENEAKFTHILLPRTRVLVFVVACVNHVNFEVEQSENNPNLRL